MRLHQLSVLGFLLVATTARAQVIPGVEVLLADSGGLVHNRRVALLTNHTGLDRAGHRDVDLLRSAGVRLVALFSPEHGFQGREDRPGLSDATDSATGLPIYSLFGRSPTRARAALDSVDVVLVDLQDIGARYYTYAATAITLLRWTAERGIPFVVLDRPDPEGGILVQGNVRAVPGPDSLVVGFLPVPMRHGMTLGELLRFANDTLGIHGAVTVVPARGWKRGMVYDQTGLPWIKPSPNMPSVESALHYPGTCLFEGTNLSVGRGTPYAFQVVGAPWLDPRAVLAKAREMGGGTGLRGVELRPFTFTPHHPTDGKYAGVALKGIRLRVTDRAQYDPTKTAVLLLAALRAAQPDSFQIRPEWFDLLAAGPELREALGAGRAPAEIWAGWDEALARFRAVRAKYLLY
ncbi:MAG TPA: DUF1343 domain-containing protein [Gemmatimonadales bacterium]|nr:DUF1343 domain-containing protein [Gemmatimonadales bacterium]